MVLRAYMMITRGSRRPAWAAAAVDAGYAQRVVIGMSDSGTCARAAAPVTDTLPGTRRQSYRVVFEVRYVDQ